MIIVDDTGILGSGLELTAVWLNTASDLADCMAFDQAGETLSQSTAVLVESRQLIGRKRMVVTGSGDPSDTVSLKFEQCDREQVAWLRSHVGVLLCYRDHVGSKWFGFYKEAPREVQTAYRDRIDVSLSLESVTYSEAV